MTTVDRRQFVARSAAAVSAFSILNDSTRGANDRMVAAIIGLGRGQSTFLPQLLERNDVSVSTICDVDQSRIAPAAQSIQKAVGSPPKVVEDFRRILDDKDINVVFIATPHHWHSPMAVPALEAGKDVYVEKPASHVFREGRRLVDAAKKNNRIFQHGTQMRSSDVTAKAGELLKSGIIGEVKMTKAWNVQRHNHRQPVPDAPIPKGVNYDLWIGPAPHRPFNPHRFTGYWNWFRDYGNGDIGNDGIHDIDMARWGLGVETHPIRVTGHGSKIDLKGEREFPDNMTVAYHYAEDKVLLYEDRGWTPYGLHGFDSGNAFYGTEGYMIFSRRGYFQVFLGPKEEKGPGMRGNTGWPDHLTNFLDSVRSRRQTNADALTAHLSCALVHLGEIAFRTERVLHFDPQNETIANDKEANAMLTKEYRQPWKI